MASSPLLKRALDQAAVWHRDQRRKYPGADVPYASHVAGVAITLARHGFSEEVVAAGALHDTIEDTAATFEDLVEHFGETVAILVRHCSEHDKSQPWEVRKQQYLDRFPGKPWEAQAITLADKIDNLHSLVVCAHLHGNPWDQLKRGRRAQLSRYRVLLELSRKLSPHLLIDEYAAALAHAERVAEDGSLI